MFSVFANRSFCLFVSQIPCGTFSRWDGESDNSSSKESENDLRKYKIVGVNRKPGRGELCPKAACIHKIAKWTIFGLQGSQLIDITRRPITFDRIVIGNCEKENFQFDHSIIENRITVNMEEYGSIESKFQYPQITSIHFADKFQKKEFIRNKIPCGSSIVAWSIPDNKTMQCEILANGHRLGATKKNTKCNFGSSSICDLYLYNQTQKMLNKFKKL